MCIPGGLIVEGQLLVELKTVEQIHPVHHAQVLTYLRLAGVRQGLLINFNAKLLKDGLKSFLMGQQPESAEAGIMEVRRDKLVTKLALAVCEADVGLGRSGVACDDRPQWSTDSWTAGQQNPRSRLFFMSFVELHRASCL